MTATTRSVGLTGTEAFIAGDRRRALALGRPMADRVSGTALMADISGFTPLTEALVRELGAQLGAEQLTAVLDRVFDAVLGELHRYGGSVVYFSGDAVTCWLDGDDGSYGVACGLAMQDAMAGVAEATTPGGTTVRLGMKVAVVTGPARRFVVGDPDVQLIDVLAGAVVDRLAATEQAARVGEVVLDGQTASRLQGRAQLVELRGEGQGTVGVVSPATVRAPAPVVLHTAELPPLPEEVTRQWLLPAVYEQLAAGQGLFLAELRPAVPMFVRFGGTDYDNEPDAHERLDRFVRQVQRVVHGYGGSLLQLTLGDKGAYLYAVFGSPRAHEDDGARACAAALDVLGLASRTEVSGLSVGLARGWLRSGASGHRHRRTFCCLGDAVNLAARLMVAAPPQEAYVEAGLAEEAGASFVFEPRGELRVKGKAGTVAVQRLVGRPGAGLARRRRSHEPLVGREEELGLLVGLADEARAGRGGVVALVAEAGMGKSRLVEELAAEATRHGLAVHSGAAPAVGGGAGYLAWRGIWRELLDVPEDGPVEPALRRALAAAGPELVERLPLLGAVTGATLEDNPLTRSFDAKLRKASLESLLARYLVLRAGQGPLVLVIEDCHWLGTLSEDLLGVICAAIGASAVLVVLTYRPGDFVAPALPYTRVLELGGLDRVSAGRLVAGRWRSLYGGAAPLPDRLVDRLVERAEGNAFYLEELVSYLHTKGVSPEDEAAVARLELPMSLASLVLSRMDAVGERPRATLKVASVVGRDFATPVLRGAHPDLGGEAEVDAHLGQLCNENLVAQLGAGRGRYSFRHAVIRDVAYESIPLAMRTDLHGRVGNWLEASGLEALDLLAHHFWLSADQAKKLHYLLAAARSARGRYANDVAVDYFRRAAPLLEEEPRQEVLMELGGVLELKGDFVEAESVFGEALELAARRGDRLGAARARTARAAPVQKQGDLERARAELGLARPELEALGDGATLGRVAHLCGTIAAQRGDYAAAREHYEASLGIRRALGDRAAEASVLSNLAIVAEYEQDYARARDLNEQALAVRRALGDRWGTGVSENNLGMVAFLEGDFAGSRAHLEEALQVEQAVGDSWMVAIARHNLGNTMREMGEPGAAGRNYEQALAAYAAAGDKWAQCLLLEDIAMLVAALAPRGAARLVGAAEAVREETGSPRVPALQQQLDQRLAVVAEHLGDDLVNQTDLGRRLSLGDARELALALCRDHTGPARPISG